MKLLENPFMFTPIEVLLPKGTRHDGLCESHVFVDSAVGELFTIRIYKRPRGRRVFSCCFWAGSDLVGFSTGADCKNEAVQSALKMAGVFFDKDEWSDYDLSDALQQMTKGQAFSGHWIEVKP